MTLLSRYDHIELSLEEKRKGSFYIGRLRLRRNDVNPTSLKRTATDHSLAEFNLCVPEDERDGTARPAYDIFLVKIGFLHNAIDEIRAMAREGRKDGEHNHMDTGTFLPIGDS